MVEWLPSLFGFLGGGALVSLFTLWADRNKRRADVGKVDAEAAVTLIAGWERMILPLRAEVARLSTAHEDCEKRNDLLQEETSHQRREIDRLKSRVAELESHALPIDASRIAVILPSIPPPTSS